MREVPERYLPIKELSMRVQWLIRLRWIAIVCLFIVITTVRYVLGLGLSNLALYAANALLLVSNICYTLVHRRLIHSEMKELKPGNMNAFINFQITFDLILLTCLLHFSGGIENPFILFYIFHMVIASILLPNRAAYMQACIAVSLFGCMVFFELSGLLSHHHIRGFIPLELMRQNRLYILGILSALAATLFVTVYMTTSIVNTLRKREGELETAIGRLEDKDREKSRYVLTLSHDIKGSLTAIQSCLKVVLDGLVGAVASKPMDLIQRSEKRSRRLLRFVEELLYLSTIRAEDNFRKNKLIFSDITVRTSAEFASALAERNIELIVVDHAEQAMINVDPDAFHQLLTQLLDNALKYTPSGGTVRIELLRSIDRGGLVLTVADTGSGISDEDLPHIFEDFYQADCIINRETPSTGLGLAIVRQIVLMHGGQITVESKTGKGSLFRLIFPTIPNKMEV